MDLKLIFWETTRACNLGCSHCRASAQTTSSTKELNTSCAKTFIKQVVDFAKPVLVFSGGEPLVRKDIYQLIHYAARLGLRTALATNATLINKSVAAKLKQSELDIVAVSVYGPDAKSHDNFCGFSGAFAQSMEGIANLKKIGIPFQINTTITKRNLKDLEKIGKLARQLSAVAYHPFFLVPTGRGRYIKGDEITSLEYEEAFNRLCDFQLDSPLPVKPTCAPHYWRVLAQRKLNLTSVRKGCLVGQSVCFVSYSGNVFGCGYLPISAGNIKSQDIKTIWLESELFKELRDNSKLRGKCGACEFKQVCGGCRARAYAASGDYLEQETECAYQPLTVKS